jgi:hypothetical protein
MRFLRNTSLFVTLIAGLVAFGAEGQKLNLEQTIDRIFQRENQEAAMLRQYSPVIETYVQDMSTAKDLGMVPSNDHYFLGKANLSQGAVEQPASLTAAEKPKKKGWFHKGEEDQKKGGLSGAFAKETVPNGFLQMAFVDAKGFDRLHYRMNYVRREFLGDVRCLVFDVMPSEKDVKGRFLGRIWVEDQDYTIVRFDGTNAPDNPKGLRPHFDSWRVNVAPGVWVPAYIYSAETEASDLLWKHVRFRAQTRLWGYNAKVETDEDRTKEESERARLREAEGRAVDRLEASGLLAPAGSVSKILRTVVNNLEVSNNLDIDPEIDCRVMLTSTLESFTIGHTIVISRGLLDVLPDEASLAAILAHEIGHILSAQAIGDKWAFTNWSIFPTEGKFTHFDYPIEAHDEEVANQKALELLRKSPYKDKLESAALFLKLLDEQSKLLPNLVSPHVESRAVLASQLAAIAPHAGPGKGPEIAALPIGSRIKMDPWTNQVEVLKSKPVALVEGSGKQPFQISPFMPYLNRLAAGNGAKPQSRDVSKQDKENEQ